MRPSSAFGQQPGYQTKAIPRSRAVFLEVCSPLDPPSGEPARSRLGGLLVRLANALEESARLADVDAVRAERDGLTDRGRTERVHAERARQAARRARESARETRNG